VPLHVDLAAEDLEQAQRLRDLFEDDVLADLLFQIQIGICKDQSIPVAFEIEVHGGALYGDLKGECGLAYRRGPKWTTAARASSAVRTAWLVWRYNIPCSHSMPWSICKVIAPCPETRAHRPAPAVSSPTTAAGLSARGAYPRVCFQTVADRLKRDPGIHALDGGEDGGQILTCVRGDGLKAVEAACRETLDQGVHSAPVIMIILAHGKDAALPALPLIPASSRLGVESVDALLRRSGFLTARRAAM
jgi:hypothetical protein